jgi:hypothetical protein
MKEGRRKRDGDKKERCRGKKDMKRSFQSAGVQMSASLFWLGISRGLNLSNNLIDD